MPKRNKMLGLNEAQPQDPMCSIKIEQGQKGGIGCEIKAEGKTPREAFNRAEELYRFFKIFKSENEKGE
jgi:hypothetical protein